MDQFIKNNFDINDSNFDQSFELIASCVDKIYSEEEVWSTDDVSKKEVLEFLEQMNSIQFKEIEKFFETMPKLSHTLRLPILRLKLKVKLYWKDCQVFRVGMAHMNLESYFRLNFVMKYHKYSLTEIENMIARSVMFMYHFFRTTLKKKRRKQKLTNDKFIR